MSNRAGWESQKPRKFLTHGALVIEADGSRTRNHRIDSPNSGVALRARKWHNCIGAIGNPQLLCAGLYCFGIVWLQSCHRSCHGGRGNPFRESVTT